MRQVMILGGLLAVSLVGSYLTWTAEETEQKATDVLVLQATTDTLTEIVWEGKLNTVKLTRPSDDQGTWVRIEHTERTEITPEPTEGDAPEATEGDAPEAPEEAPAPEAPATAEEVAEPEYESTTTVFAGNEQADELWSAFSPLYAMRELVGMTDASLASFELDEPRGTLRVTVGGKTSELALGGESFGTRDIYVKLDSRVFLIDDKTLRPLKIANTRLVERRLQPLRGADLRGVTVRRDGATRDYVHTNPEDRKSSFWALADQPKETNVEAATWLDKLQKLRVKGYVNESDLPEDATPLFSFDASGEDETWTAEILRSGDGDTLRYFAKSTFTRSLTELTKTVAEDAIADLDTLFDDSAPEPQGDAGE